METTIMAKFNKGVIKPLGKLKIKEGKEILITVKEFSPKDRFLKAAGGWKETINCEKLIKDIYRTRLLKTRPEPKI